MCEVIEFVILLRGGCTFWEFPKADHAANQRMLIDLMRESRIESKVVHVGNNFLWSDSVLGFYAREPKESTGEKLVDLQREVISIVRKASNEGDEWRGE